MVLGCVHLPAWPWLPRKPGDLALLISRPHVASLALRDPPPQEQRRRYKQKVGEDGAKCRWGSHAGNASRRKRQESSPGVLLGPPQGASKVAKLPWFLNSPLAAVVSVHGHGLTQGRAPLTDTLHVKGKSPSQCPDPLLS